jgi:hypothetical protein
MGFGGMGLPFQLGSTNISSAKGWGSRSSGTDSLPSKHKALIQEEEEGEDEEDRGEGGGRGTGGG